MPEKVLLPLAVSTRGCLEATTELDNVRRVVMVAAVGGAPVRVVKVLLPLAVSTRGCLEATTEVMCATTGQSRGPRGDNWINRLTSREVVMRKFAIPALATAVLITLTTMSTPAAASHSLKQTCKADCLKSHCDAAGGHYYTGSKISGCSVGTNNVTCDNKTGKCLGTDPQRLGQGGKNGPVAVGGSKQSGPASGTTGTGAATPVSAGGSKQTGGNKKQ